MTMNRRRLILTIGAALLVGGWATMRFDVVRAIAGKTNFGSYAVSIMVVISMAIGAGLIGFAVLRPTNDKGE